MTRVLSGTQPSGVLHLGNYFGAIKQHVELADRHPGECFYFIADFHALTTLQDADQLRASSRDLAVTYLACGLDPDKALLFRQSDVPEVTELAWLLATVTGMGLLERATSYKDKVARGLPASVGLFSYPVLMAADILSYDADIVPVGKDQIQHVEMTQDMATHFNQTYGKGEEVLRRPEFRLSEAPYVVGTDGQKMSKSYGNVIPLFESGKRLRKIVGGIVTDSTPLGQPLDPDKCTVFALLKLFADAAEQEKIAGWYRSGRRDPRGPHEPLGASVGAPIDPLGGRWGDSGVGGGEAFGYGHAKLLLADHIERHFSSAREKREELVAHPERVDELLRRSGERARAVAQTTLNRCKRACGLR